MNLPAPAHKVRREVQRVLGFEGDEIDGEFGPKTHAKFRELKDGDTKLGVVQVLLGFTGREVDLDMGPATRFRFQQLDDFPDLTNWPVMPGAPLLPEVSTHPRNAMRGPLSSVERANTFGGPFQWRRRPVSGNSENIDILHGWEEENIIRVEIPQLRAVPGNFSAMRWNKRAYLQLTALWAAWEKAGLLHLVKSYEGAYVPRLIRGSTSSLSNHAYGTAFDINYHWNQLGRVPAAAGREGSVRELVPLAHEHGFYWGGNFSRLDGHHFEICKILS